MLPSRKTLTAMALTGALAACGSLPSVPVGFPVGDGAAANTCPDIATGPGVYPGFPVDCDGVVSSENGLRWIELATGAASERGSPVPGSTLVVDYEGFLADTGRKIDSSYSRDEAGVFQIDDIIQGWGQTLQRMTPGDEWLVYIPSELAYGAEARGDLIPANSDLVFKMRLQGFLTPTELAAQAAAAESQAQAAAAPVMASGPDMDAWQANFPWDRTAPGVNMLPSGVSYVRLERGNSPKPNATVTDKVLIHYEGRLAETSEFFDSSWSRGEPTEFPVSGVIPGFTEVLTYMGEGDRVLVHIPADRAYGDAGAGDSIPPNADIMFQINLLQILPGE